MADDLVDETVPLEERLPEEPHLHDLGSIHEVANWILLAATSGVIGNAVYDVLQAVRRRFGVDRVAAVRERVYEELKRTRGKRHLSNEDLRLRVDRIFADFDS